MRNVIKGVGAVFILGAGLIGISVANAATTCSMAGLNCVGPANEVVTGIFPSDAGDILLKSPATVAGTGCTGAAGGPNIRLESAHALFKETYAATLTASSLNSKVTLRVAAGAGNECVLKYYRIETGG